MQFCKSLFKTNFLQICPSWLFCWQSGWFFFQTLQIVFMNNFFCKKLFPDSSCVNMYFRFYTHWTSIQRQWILGWQLIVPDHFIFGGWGGQGVRRVTHHPEPLTHWSEWLEWSFPLMNEPKYTYPQKQFLTCIVLFCFVLNSIMHVCYGIYI